MTRIVDRRGINARASAFDVRRRRRRHTAPVRRSNEEKQSIGGPGRRRGGPKDFFSVSPHGVDDCSVRYVFVYWLCYVRGSFYSRL